MKRLVIAILLLSAAAAQAQWMLPAGGAMIGPPYVNPKVPLFVHAGTVPIFIHSGVAPGFVH